MEKPYTVLLSEAADLSSSERIAAEVCFVKEIERALGSAEEVAHVYRAWMDASENDATNIDRTTAELACRWPKAAEAAHRAGFRNLGDLGEAHFEIRLHRAASSA